MRIISGEYGGRRISAPKGTVTRPTSDRVREALFSRLQSICGSLDDVSVLDAFAGTGAMGLEALSRGASHVTFVERDRGALQVLRSNVDSLEVESRASIVTGDAAKILVSPTIPGRPFGLLILDPPYRIGNAEVREVIESLYASSALASTCLVVWEHDSRNTVELDAHWSSLGSKAYGTTTVSIFEMHTET